MGGNNNAHQSRGRSASPVGRSDSPPAGHGLPTVQQLAHEIVLLKQQLANTRISTNGEQAVLASHNAIISALNQRSSSSSPGMIKPRDPPLFNGSDRRYAAAWIENMEQQFELRKINDDHTKILFASASLEKDAMYWWTNVKTYVPDWITFKGMFNKNYQAVDVAEKAGQTLLSIVQITSVERLNEIFRQNRYLANPRIYTDLVCKELYWKALKPKIKLYISRFRMKDMSLEELMSSAQEADREVFALERVEQTGNTRPHRVPFISGGNRDSGMVQVKAELGAVGEDEQINFSQASNTTPGKITDSERARCWKDSLCFRCRQPGHVAKQCTKFQKKV
jgi:hypothetical protein